MAPAATALHPPHVIVLLPMHTTHRCCDTPTPVFPCHKPVLAGPACARCSSWQCVSLVLLRLVGPKHQCSGVVKWVKKHPELVKRVMYHSQRHEGVCKLGVTDAHPLVLNRGRPLWTPAHRWLCNPTSDT